MDAIGKDLHNAKYVCPTDLKAEHDRYVIKKAKANARLEVEKQLEKEEDYRQAKEKFFGLMFSDGLISVRVLESVAEIVAEGRAMKHCVASYHSKADSLILTACIDGKKIETIELSLSQLRVIQSRRKCNKCTEYRPNSKGLVSIMARITVNGQITQFNTKLEVNPDIWDTKTRQSKRS